MDIIVILLQEISNGKLYESIQRRDNIDKNKVHQPLLMNERDYIIKDIKLSLNSALREKEL